VLVLERLVDVVAVHSSAELQSKCSCLPVSALMVYASCEHAAVVNGFVAVWTVGIPILNSFGNALPRNNSPDGSAIVHLGV